MSYSDNSDSNQNEITEGTNMMVDYLANSEKLRKPDERWYYTKNNNNNNNNDDDDMDDDFDSYKKTDRNQRSEENINNDKNNSDNHSDSNYNDTSKNDDKYTDVKEKAGSNDKYIDEDYENLSTLEKRLRRLDYMRKLGELRDLGCKVTNYSIDDDYYMMKYEYELHTSIRTKRNWMGLYNHMLIGGVKLLELGNDRYNPFDFSLKGLSNEVSSDKTTYYEILGEIYEHYNVPGKKMNPWFRLAINLIGTLTVVGGKNNAHKFLPKAAGAVENDEAMLENLRSRAMGQTSNTQQSTQQATQQAAQQNNLDEFMNKEHDKAAQRVKDLEDLKRQELEFQQYQKMLVEDNSKFTNIKKQLEMSQQSPDSKASSRSRSLQRTTSVRPVPIKKESTESTESDSRSTLSNQTTQSTMSTRSTVSINKKLAAQLKSGQTTIKASSISFGSSNKGKKSAISIGRN
jgi:hypothetical protein